jgi:nucleoside-diphosphate-sugar epimerase
MRILITGNMGYVGTSLGRFLCEGIPAVELVGYDTALYGHLLTNTQTLPESRFEGQCFGDIRDLPESLLQGVDAIVHLAAVSNDPIGNQFESVTAEINQAASTRLAHLARKAGVQSFVFASSCSVYGASESTARTEHDPPSPITAYARSKVGTERALAAADLAPMRVTCLRFATACGMSERLRLDLVLNDFVASALVSGEITVLSDGTPWRPLIDVQDMARAISWAIERPAENGGPFLVVNVGGNDANYQVKDLAAAVAGAVPNTRVTINTMALPDKRSYRVDFSLFERLAPHHVPRVSLTQSVRELCDGLTAMAFTDTKFRNSSYIRLKAIEQHIAAGRLSPELRWRMNRCESLGAKGPNQRAAPV